MLQQSFRVWFSTKCIYVCLLNNIVYILRIYKDTRLPKQVNNTYNYHIQTKIDTNLLCMTSPRTHIRGAAPFWCIWTALELLSSISHVACRSAGSADTMVLLIQREWPVWQLLVQSVDQALSSGAYLSYIITRSYIQPTFFVPRSRIDVCRL